MDLHSNETFLINALRTFDAFLSSIGYRIVGYSYDDQDGDVIVYEAPFRNRWIHIAFVVDFDILVIRRRGYWFLKKREVVSLKEAKMSFPDFAGLPIELDMATGLVVFDGYKKLMSEKLLPILTGEKWFQNISKANRLKVSVA